MKLFLALVVVIFLASVAKAQCPNGNCQQPPRPVKSMGGELINFFHGDSGASGQGPVQAMCGAATGFIQQIHQKLCGMMEKEIAFVRSKPVRTMVRGIRGR